MKKRTFLKSSVALIAGGLFGPTVSCMQPSKQEKAANKGPVRYSWAGNLAYHAGEYYEPESVADLKELVKQKEKVRVLGTRHCFNSMADSEHCQVSVKKLNKIVSIDEEKQQATIEAGASYGLICRELHARGFALHNLASLPHISVAGAAATATHGSGIRNPNLGSAIKGMEFVNAEGELVNLSAEKNGEVFTGMVTHLGCLGVITKLVLQLQPTFDVSQRVFLDLPVKELLAHFPEIMGKGYSVSLFTDYQTDKVNQVWVKSKLGSDIPPEDGKDFFGAKPAGRNVHPILKLPAESCTGQLGVPGPWFERLPHFKMEFTPSSGKELQSEFFVPAAKAVEVYQVISELKALLAPLLMISEIRTIAADEQWMSPCYQRDCVTFHFTMEQDQDLLNKVLPVIEDRLRPYDARPHWGKIFTPDPIHIQSLYPKLSELKKQVAIHDPKGKFRNTFIEKLLFT